MNDFNRGVLAGLAGTAVMSAAMAASRAAGAMRREVPPRVISDHAERAIGVRHHLSRPAFEASWVANHLAYGAAAGVAYAAIDRRFGPSPLVAGPAFGVSLWIISYGGWLPAVGLYPPPTEDAPDRVATMIAHHLIYGTTTALAAWALRPIDAAAAPRAPTVPT